MKPMLSWQYRRFFMSILPHYRIAHETQLMLLTRTPLQVHCISILKSCYNTNEWLKSCMVRFFNLICSCCSILTSKGWYPPKG